MSSALQNTALTIGTLSSGFLVLSFGVREVYIGLAVVMIILVFLTSLYSQNKLLVQK